MNGKPCYLAIDSGTSRMKAALFDEKNGLIDIAAADLNVLYPFDGASEADMNETWDTLCSLFSSLAKRNPECWKEIIGIGITGQGDGAWMVAENGQPARNAVLWNDTRTKATRISNKLELDQYCQKNSISPVFQGANYYILKWVKENEPDVFNRISKVIHCKDWLNFKLTGSFATDYSDTSTSMLNSSSMAYDFNVLSYMGFDNLEYLFPPNHYSDEVMGQVSKETAAKTGLKPGTPVITGSIDVAGVASGTGAVEPGDTIAIIGTTCCVTMILEKSQLNYTDTRGSTLCHQDRDRYLRLMAMSNGTASLDWVRKTILSDTSFAEIEQKISVIKAGSEGVIFQPYLYGERAPFRNASACGSFLGLTARHTPYHLIRASYEGLALALLSCCQALPDSNSQIYVAGGGAASNVLCQIISDCLGRVLQRPRTGELGLYGIVKAIKKGVGRPAQDAGIQGIGDLFQPDATNHKRYQELSHIFTESIQIMNPWWQERDFFLNAE